MPTVVERIQSRLPDRCSQVQILLHAADASLLVPGHEADDRSGGPGSGRAPGPVQVVLGVAGGVKMDHERDRLDVEAAGGNVGGDQRLGATGRERMQRPVALALGAPAVHGDRAHAQLDELLGEPVGTVAGSGEHDRAARRVD